MKRSPEAPAAIDMLAGVLPMAARDRLADSLDAAEIDTLAHLAKAGTGANSLRALASDLAYLEAWSHAATDAALAWPASETSVLRFIAHHLWDEEERAKNPEHGMPESVDSALRAEGRLRSSGPHAPATVRRRLALWATLHRWRGVEGPFGGPAIRNALRLSIRAADRPPARKSAVSCSNRHHRLTGITISPRVFALCSLWRGSHVPAFPNVGGGAVAQHWQSHADVRPRRRERFRAPAVANNRRQAGVSGVRLHDLPRLSSRSLSALAMQGVRLRFFSDFGHAVRLA